ncbi:hypothetical protein GLYMA_15G046201v4 [Glycine max]|nr:hypothetical protein GLYMA_15G046201v4 [Glycine max]KAH1145572.1 hypothetical protein GYH30_041342 [Glycine max]
MPFLIFKFGVNLETGFLLYGPPGCGKTLIAKAVVNEAGANFIHIKGPELLNKYVGESELQVCKMFSRARTCAPCILFFSEIDTLTTKRGKEGGWVIERLLNQLLVGLDGAEERRDVFVVGATNRPEVMDRAVLLRPGRFGKLLYVPLPSPDERVLILKALARKEAVDASVDLSDIAKMEACENLSGADLAALVCLCSLLMLSVSSLYHCCMLCMYVYGCLILGGYKVLQLQRLDYRKSGSQFERDTDFMDYTDE